MIDAKELVAGIDECVQAISNKQRRWDNLEKYYRNEPPPVIPAIEDGVSIHLPLVSETLDSLSALVVNTITGESPHCIPLCYEDEEANAVQERVVQFFSEKDGLKYALKQIGPVCGTTNKAIIEVSYDRDESKFEFTPYEPKSFVCYPTWVPKLEDCKFCGHMFYRRKSEIIRLQREGFYKQGPIQDADIDDNVNLRAASRNVPSNPVADGDKSIKLYRLLVKDGEGWKQVILEPNSATILREEDWTYSLNYFEFGYKPAMIGDGFYPSHSVANDIQELQIAANTLLSDAYNGQRMSAFGVGMAPKGVDTNQSYIRYRAGSFMTGMAEGTQIHFPSVNIGATIPLLQLLIQKAYDTARVSDALRGQQTGQNKTATQTQFEAMGSQKAVDEFIETFGEGVIGIFHFMHDCLSKNFDKWAKKFGKTLKLGEESKAQMAKGSLWSLKVSSIGATATSQFALLQQLIAMSQNPAFKFDTYKLGEATLNYAERLGLINASEYQHEDDPMEAIQTMADELGGALGVDPNLIIAAVAGAIEMASDGGMGQVPGLGMPQSNDIGDFAPGGVSPDATGVGQGMPGTAPGGVPGL